MGYTKYVNHQFCVDKMAMFCYMMFVVDYDVGIKTELVHTHVLCWLCYYDNPENPPHR